MNIRGKVNYKEVLKGDIGFTYTPHVTKEGILYWTNNGNLPNPYPVNIHGEQGFYFTPHVDEEGNLSWSNNGDLINPSTVNIMGERGYYFTPHVSEDGILTWTNNGNLPNPNPFNINDLILNEVKESRTATTGEIFNNLDERIDHEINRLRKSIDITMLEQNDKDFHDIDHTVEGMTTDMTIKGRTLQNLFTPELVKEQEKYLLINSLPNNQLKDGIFYVVNNTDKIVSLNVYRIDGMLDSNPILKPNSINKLDLTGKKLLDFLGFYDRGWAKTEEDKQLLKNTCIVFDKEETYVPQKYFKGIKSFGQQEDKISILSNNENYFKLTNDNIFGIGTTITVNGNSFTTSQTNGWNQGFGIKLDRIPTGEYKILGQQTVGKTEGVIYSLNYYKNNGLKIKSVTLNSLNFEVENIDYDYLQLEFKNGTEVTTIGYDYIMVVPKDVTLNSYIERKNDKKDILLQNLGFDEGLRGFNANSYDELNSITGKAIKKIEKYSFRGDENLEQQSINEHGIVNFLFKIDNIKGGIGISNKLKQQKTIIANTIDEGFYLDEGVGIYLRINKDKADNVEKLKQILKKWHTDGDPLEIYYELLNPVETPLHENINTKVFDEKTYVSFVNVIKGTSSFKIPVDSNKLINKLISRNEDINYKFNELTKEFNLFKTLLIQTLPYREE